MRYKKRIRTFEDFIKTTIELNDKLYERVMKRRHTERQLDRVEDYVSNCVFKASRKQRHDKTIFMKINAMLSKKSKNNKKKSFDKKKIQRATRVAKKVTMRGIADRKT